VTAQIAIKLNYVAFIFLRFYGKNSSYVHGGLDNNGKPVEAVYGQSVSFNASVVELILVKVQ